MIVIVGLVLIGKEGEELHTIGSLGTVHLDRRLPVRPNQRDRDIQADLLHLHFEVLAGFEARPIFVGRAGLQRLGRVAGCEKIRLVGLREFPPANSKTIAIRLRYDTSLPPEALAILSQVADSRTLVGRHRQSSDELAQ
jgi:hypothetical protein